MLLVLKRMAQLGLRLKLTGRNWVKSVKKVLGPEPKRGEFLRVSKEIDQATDWGKNIGLSGLPLENRR